MEENSPSTIDAYIATYPEVIKMKLNEVRLIIKETAPEAEETISYKMPAFKLKGKGLIYFAAYKNHIGLYPFPAEIKEFQDAAAGFLAFKGTLQLPYAKQIPYELVRKVVKYRVDAVLEKGAGLTEHA